jgi:hypothetical protein
MFIASRRLFKASTARLLRLDTGSSPMCPKVGHGVMRTADVRIPNNVSDTARGADDEAALRKKEACGWRWSAVA